MSYALEIENTHTSVTTELELHLRKQLALCDALEEVADTIPEHIDTQKCLRLAMSLVPLVHAAHRFEEDVLFDTLRKTHADDKNLDHILDRLHAEHFEDESFGEEVAEGLRELANDKTTNYEKIGYMLRGFFEGLRRHIAFEADHILPMLRPVAGTA